MAENKNAVSLRDYFDARLASISQRIDAIDRATEIQTKDLARRLDDLNHAHQKAVEDKAQFLPRELHMAFEKEVRDKLDDFGTIRDEAKGRATISATLVSIAISIVMGLLMLGAAHFLK